MQEKKEIFVVKLSKVLPTDYGCIHSGPILIPDYLEYSYAHSVPDIRIARIIRNSDVTYTNLKGNSNNKMADK